MGPNTTIAIRPVADAMLWTRCGNLFANTVNKSIVANGIQKNCQHRT
jgi:hypothetical protein